ncbi:hypothetical protein HKD37_10G027421 [Glycine soja]
MDARMEKVEGDLEMMKSMMEAIQAEAKEAKENQSKILELVTKSLMMNINDGEEGEGSHGGGRKAKTNGEHGGKRPNPISAGLVWKSLEAEALDEFRQSIKKVELPSFTGEDPVGWISRAEIYFQVQETSDEVKVRLAQISMENGTVHFFNLLLLENENLTWEELKYELMQRYAGKGTAYEQLSALQQTRSIDDYIQRFECLIAQIPKLQDEQYFACFTHGLKSLHVANLLTRGRLMNIARAVKMEMTSKNRAWVGRGDTCMESGTRTASGQRNPLVATGRTGSRNYGGKGTNGPGPNARGDGAEKYKQGQWDRGAIVP